MSYKPVELAKFYDAYADREWDRLGETIQGRNKHEIHRRFLAEYVEPGMAVLDVGCGPGRFAIDLLKMGAKVTLADLSAGQLAQARTRLQAAGLADRVEAFHQADVTRLEMFHDGQFDAVVCFGAVISYTRREHPVAFSELARVTRPGGTVLVSVASLLGSLRLLGPLDAAGFLTSVHTHLDWQAVLNKDGLVYTTPGSEEFHQPMVLMTSVGLRSALTAAGLSPVSMAAANPILGGCMRTPKIADDEGAMDALRQLEVAVCDQPGLVDCGEHIIAVATKPG